MPVAAVIENWASATGPWLSLELLFEAVHGKENASQKRSLHCNLPF
jgi:hypothetical protein